MTLEKLIGLINNAHARILKHNLTALQDAKKAGAWCLVAKAQVPRGEFMAWCDSNLHCGSRQARKYMAISERWADLEAETKRNPNAVWTLDTAARFCSKLKQKARPPRKRKELPAPEQPEQEQPQPEQPGREQPEPKEEGKPILLLPAPAVAKPESKIPETRELLGSLTQGKKTASATVSEMPLEAVINAKMQEHHIQAELDDVLLFLKDFGVTEETILAVGNPA